MLGGLQYVFALSNNTSGVCDEGSSAFWLLNDVSFARVFSKNLDEGPFCSGAAGLCWLTGESHMALTV